MFTALSLPVFLMLAAEAQLPNSMAKSPAETIKYLESQARQYVTSMNRAQQAYYAENVGFTSSVANLGMGIKPQTDNYTYAISAGNKAVFNYGISRQANLKSFVGGVFLTANKTQTIVCQASVAGRARPANPTNKNGVLACGANTAVPQLAGLFHSQGNQGFVKVVPPCLPSPSTFAGVSGIGATTGDCPYKE